MNLVEVEWVDANYQRDQLDMDEALRLDTPTVLTHGVLLENTDQRVTVAGEVLYEKESGKMRTSYRAVTVVPKGMVKRVRRLQGGKG